jgi:superoxide reductase
MVGENLHPMGPSHWIEYIELSIGNEPAGRLEFQPRGFMKPKAVFTIAIPKDAAPSGKITLVARQRCNLHGLWESSADISIT